MKNALRIFIFKKIDISTSYKKKIFTDHAYIHKAFLSGIIVYLRRIFNPETHMEETFKTRGVCATTIQFTRDGDKIRNIRFTGGCNGNLKAIAKLCEGMSAEDIAAKLLGNTCGGKPTSCADQLARAVLGKEA